MTRTLYDALGGETRVRDLAAAWHRRVLDDEVVAHAFSHGFHDHHVDRLAAYFVEQLGGPPRYSAAGWGDETEVVRMHSGNGEHDEMDARALDCFAAAADDLAVDEPLRVELVAWFAQRIADMSRYPRSPDDVPDGLSIGRWPGRIA